MVSPDISPGSVPLVVVVGAGEVEEEGEVEEGEVSALRKHAYAIQGVPEKMKPICNSLYL